MNRSLQYLNLFGVLALAGLCGGQRRINRELNLQINGLEKTRQQHVTKLGELEQALKGIAADLDDFRAQLTGGQYHPQGHRDEARRG